MRRALPCIPAVLLAAVLYAPAGLAQAPAKMQFEVASVRENKSNDKPYSNFPLGPQSQYIANGGRFEATNRQLIEYIIFGYVKTIYQIQQLRPQLPEWTRGVHYDIRTTAEGNPTKDEMRLMMQSLLEDRFKMKVHHEMRQVPVFALVLVKPDKLGPDLQQHAVDDPECKKKPLPVDVAPGGYGVTCGTGTQTPPSAPGLTAMAGQKIPMAMIAVSLTGASTEIDRPVIDRTGLTGTFDYRLEWAPTNMSATPGSTDPPAQLAGPSFQQALKEQLGVKLVPSTGEVDVIVLDHIERPSEN